MLVYGNELGWVERTPKRDIAAMKCSLRIREVGNSIPRYITCSICSVMVLTYSHPRCTDRDGEYHSQRDARKLGNYNPPMACKPPSPVIKTVILPR